MGSFSCWLHLAISGYFSSLGIIFMTPYEVLSCPNKAQQKELANYPAQHDHVVLAMRA